MFFSTRSLNNPLGENVSFTDSGSIFHFLMLSSLLEHSFNDILAENLCQDVIY